MCAIAGELRFDGARVDAKNLVRMRDTMIHRGPDGEGLYISPNQELGFGHRRLSIIDLSEAAAQPMLSVDRKSCVVFNGEIYNHVELRRELTALGQANWSTDHSDTEVILNAYRQWGIDFLTHLRGMFAIGLWDQNKRQLLIARDRLGIKPLYYLNSGSRFLFASEIKAILAAPDVPRLVNEESLFHFLTFATTPAPETLFSGIQKLPAGHFALLTDKGMSEPKRYWELWDHVSDLSRASEDEICERLLAELETSVQLHKVSDVPVGVFLSGGVDSSVNTILFSKNQTRPTDTFTIDYESDSEAHRSEAAFASQIADLVHARKHFKRLTAADLLEFLPTMIHLQDEPFADPVCVPVYYVSKLARDSGIKVCQVGEGADEIFCGYANWMRHYRIDQLKSKLGPKFMRDMALFALRSLNKKDTFTYEATRRAFAGELQFWAGAEAFSEKHKRELLSPRLRERFQNFSSKEIIDPIRRRFVEKAPDQSIVQWMAYIDMHIRLPETLLMRIDKMGMGVSIESRVPFLDHKFVELAMSVPAHLKVRGGEAKHIFRHAVRNIVPPEILRRKKQGFSVPLEDWFLRDLAPLMREELKSFCAQTDFFSWTEVEKLLDNQKALQCWFLLNIALWWKNWIVN